jgi:hypothetical protein
MKSQDFLLIGKIICLQKYNQLLKKEISTANPQAMLTIYKKKYDNNYLEQINIAEIKKIYNQNIHTYLRKYNKSLEIHKLEKIFESFDIHSTLDDQKYTLIGLEKSTGISKSQISLSLQRCITNKLLFRTHNNSNFLVNTKAFYELIVHAVKYFFPISRGSLAKGIPISYASPFLYDKILSSKRTPLVWPYNKGDFIEGESIEPIYKTIPYAANNDPMIYELFTLIDSLRIDNIRENKIANDLLKNFLFNEAGDFS